MDVTLKSELYRKLPSVDELLRNREMSSLIHAEGQPAVAEAIRAVLLRVREEISAGQLDPGGVDLAVSGIPQAVERELHQALEYSLRPVINATGVILHTNLGRAPLAGAAFDHIREVAAGYSNLEFDIARGERGRREVHVDKLFRQLLAKAHAAVGLRLSPADQSSLSTRSTSAHSIEPAVSTIVVNNNAAAVLLALNTLADGGEVIVSRGELVEIGGSFRIPEVMAKSGARLREVGTTNRTRLSDYEKAMTGNTRLLLRVHRSNFQITGFTEQPRIADLAALAHKHDLPLFEDLGSGALYDLPTMGVSDEPGVIESLQAGVDVVSYSGDKLLGGPQAGILSGRGDLIARMRANSLFRALRVDKLTYAALETTLLAYVKQDYGAIPALRMMRLSKDEIGVRAEALAKKICSPRVSVEVVDGESVIGGGAAPSAVLPTRLLALVCDGISADDLARQLRLSDPPVIARMEDGRVLLDLRTVSPDQDAVLGAVCRVRAEGSSAEAENCQESRE